MKEIYVLRHGEWNYDNKCLSEDAIKQFKDLKIKMPAFDKVVTSRRPRTRETARLLTDLDLEIDNRLDELYLNEEQRKELERRGNINTLGTVATYFDRPDLRQPLRELGERVVVVFKETLEQLPEEGKALIVSHHSPIVAAEKVLQHEPFDRVSRLYKTLEGYIVNEKLEIVNRIVREDEICNIQ